MVIGGNPAYGPGLFRRGIFDVLRLIGDHALPLDLLITLRVAGYCPVAGDDEIRPPGMLRELGVGHLPGPVIHENGKAVDVAGGLGLPGSKHRGGCNHQGRAGSFLVRVLRRRLFFLPCQQGQHLQGLPQPHVIGQNGPQAVLCHPRQPVHTAALMFAQFGQNRRGKLHVSGGCYHVLTVEELAHPAVHIHPDVVVRVIVSACLGGGLRLQQLCQRDLAEFRRILLRRVRERAEPPASLAQRALVQEHELPVDLHDLASRADELQLVRLPNRGAVHREVPFEVQELVHPELPGARPGAHRLKLSSHLRGFRGPRSRDHHGKAGFLQPAGLGVQ